MAAVLHVCCVLVVCDHTYVTGITGMTQRALHLAVHARNRMPQDSCFSQHAARRCIRVREIEDAEFDLRLTTCTYTLHIKISINTQASLLHSPILPPPCAYALRT